VELDPIRLRIMRLIQASDTDLKNASRTINKNDAYLHQYLYRGTPKVLPEDVREDLAALLGVSPDDLRPEVESRSRAGPVTPPGALGPVQRERFSLSGFVAVTEIDVRASAGPGALQEGLEEAKGTWMFPDPVIRHEFRTRPENLNIITIDGDSMEPLLSTGDRILVDTSQRIPTPPGIFVIWDGMGLVAKRVEHVPHSDPPKVIIKSVNPEYQTYEREAEEVKIIGRVIWAAKRL
jgi:phage repressor protein C with HTH and peptisase S24 domain